MSRSRDVRHLALGLCLGIPLIVLLILTGSTLLLRAFDAPPPDEPEPIGSFVCTSDVAGTLLLCEQSYSAQPTTSETPWRAGSTPS